MCFVSVCFFFLMIRRPPRSTLDRSSAASDVYKRQAFVLSLARNAAIGFNRPIAVFSLEMSSVQLVQRMISSETGIPSDKLRKGTLDNTEWQKLVSMTGKLSSAPVYIDDTPSLSVFDLRSKCRRLKAMYGLSLIHI